MRWLAGGLIFVNIATLCGLILGIIGHGLTPMMSVIAFTIGLFAALLACFRTSDPKTELQSDAGSARRRYGNTWKWLLAACFTMFAVRSFCWLFYIDSDQFRIQSPNNLGDLSLHITLIKDFANGVPLWPDNPIFEGSKLRYPAGLDLFNALLYLQNISLIPGLVWIGLLGSLATFYAFYRWGGTFAVAAFLFNGGLVGFKFLESYQFSDYQGVNDVAWKSIPLSMFVTQRGLLYAVPAGLLLLWHWREKFFSSNGGTGSAQPATHERSDAGAVPSQIPGTTQRSSLQQDQGPLPFWVELSLYASMPLFHVHTFLALSGVLVCLAILGDASTWKPVALLIGCAVVPATILVWLITDGFQAGSVFAWHPGWVQSDKGDELAAPFFLFWIKNFGVWMPLILFLLWWCGSRLFRLDRVGAIKVLGAITILAIGLCIFRIGKVGFEWPWAIILLFFFSLLGWGVFSIMLSERAGTEKLSQDAVFLFAAIAIFLVGFFIKTAPWGWDNLKLMMWGYFLVVPFLWQQIVKPWPIAVRAAAFVMLFGSGFVSLFGGLAAGRPGFGFADRAEVAGVGHAVAALPVTARFAAYPTYNHPLLLEGRNVILGYLGHLWTEGFNYDEKLALLNQLMNGNPTWRDDARRLQVRYIFWGREETANYPNSKHPWETTTAQIASGTWGAIYDLNFTTNR